MKMVHQIIDAAKLPFNPVAGAASPEVIAAASLNGTIAGSQAGADAGKAAASQVVAPAVAAIPDTINAALSSQVPPLVADAIAADNSVAQAAVDAVSAAVQGLDTVVVENGEVSSHAEWAHPTTDWVEDVVRDTVGAASTTAVPGEADWPRLGEDGLLDESVIPPVDLTGYVTAVSGDAASETVQWTRRTTDWVSGTVEDTVGSAEIELPETARLARLDEDGLLSASIIPGDAATAEQVNALAASVADAQAGQAALGARVQALEPSWSGGVPLQLAAGLSGALTATETAGRVHIVGTVTGAIAAGATIATGPGHVPWLPGQVVSGVRTVTGGLVAVSAGTSLAVDAVVQKPTLPVITVTLDDPAAVIDNENYLTASVTVDWDGTGQVTQEFTTKFRGHGNSTWNGRKKPFRFKADSKIGLLGMPKSKNWRLLANYFDPSRVRPTVFYDLGHDLEDVLGWTPHGVWAEVVIVRAGVGEYLGLYDLRESVAIDSSRLDIDELEGTETDPLDITGGWLLEADNKEKGIVAGVTTSLLGQFFAFDTPEEPNADQTAYITAFLNEVEAGIVSGDLTRIDIPSFAAFYLVSELVRNTDSWGFSSVKLWKPRASLADDGETVIDSQLHMGPLWDADMSLGVLSGYWEWGAPASGWRTRQWAWFQRLWQVEEFATAAKTMWEKRIAPAVETTIIPRLTAHVDNVRQALREDHAVLGEPDVTEQELTRIKNWLRARTAWINNNI